MAAISVCAGNIRMSAENVRVLAEIISLFFDILSVSALGSVPADSTNVSTESLGDYSRNVSVKCETVCWNCQCSF